MPSLVAVVNSNQYCPPFNTQHTMHSTIKHNRKFVKNIYPTSQWMNKTRLFTFIWHNNWYRFILCMVDPISFHHQNQISYLPTMLRKTWLCTFRETIVTYFRSIYCSRRVSCSWCEKEWSIKWLSCSIDMTWCSPHTTSKGPCSCCVYQHGGIMVSELCFF